MRFLISWIFMIFTPQRLYGWATWRLKYKKIIFGGDRCHFYLLSLCWQMGSQTTWHFFRKKLYLKICWAYEQGNFCRQINPKYYLTFFYFLSPSRLPIETLQCENNKKTKMPKDKMLNVQYLPIKTCSIIYRESWKR